MRNGGKNISFIVDDDPVICEVVRKFLSDLCEVVQIFDGNNLKEIYEKQKPDIVFLDLNMPSINGIDLLREIKAQDKEAFIIMLTSDATADNVKAALKYGADGFIAKPFNKDIIVKNFYRSPSVVH